MMDRRTLLALAGSALACSSIVRAQQRGAGLPIIGFLNSGSPATFAELKAGFLAALGDAGYIDGRNVAIEYRWAEGDYSRLPQLGAELARLPLAVLVAAGGTPSAKAAVALPPKFPVLFIASDAVGAGFVTSIGRPTGNATGVDLLAGELYAKRVQLLLEIIPRAAHIAMLTHPKNPELQRNAGMVGATAKQLGRSFSVFRASTPAEFEPAFAAMAAAQVDGMVVNNDPFFFVQRAHIVALANRHALPTIYDQPAFARQGGLVSYGAPLVDAYRQLGAYAARILKGTRVGDLPVVQPTRFNLAVNLKTAKALGLEVPPSILIRADEVIE